MIERLLKTKHRILEAVQSLGEEVGMPLTWEAPADLHTKQGDKMHHMTTDDPKWQEPTRIGNNEPTEPTAFRKWNTSKPASE